MEREMASLRLARVHIERVCTELRTELRTCRTELACNLAHASAIHQCECFLVCTQGFKYQTDLDRNVRVVRWVWMLFREKSELEERLALVATESQAMEIAWTKAQAELDDMRQVAAQTQMRVETYRVAATGSSVPPPPPLSSFTSSKELSHVVQEVGRGGNHVQTRVPRATHERSRADQFLLDHGPQLCVSVASNSTARDNRSDNHVHAVDKQPHHERRRAAPPPPSNVAALEAMKREIASDIRAQIEATTCVRCLCVRSGFAWL